MVQLTDRVKHPLGYQGKWDSESEQNFRPVRNLGDQLAEHVY